MTTRLLPAAQWDRLAGTPLADVIGTLRPEIDRVLVVEQAGAIVGTWALIPVVHVEGIWIDPAQRNTGAVARRLLRGMAEQATQMGARAVMTAAVTQDVADFAQRLGAAELPGRHFVLPLKETVCPPS